MIEYDFPELAERELRETISFYDQQKQGLGDRFLAEIETCIERVCQFPRAFPLIYREIRRVRFKRYPYSLLYKTYPDRILFVALMHDRRKPG